MLGIKFFNDTLSHHDLIIGDQDLNMRSRTLVMSATIIIAMMSLALTLVFSLDTPSLFASIDPIGLIAATFAVLIGLAWLARENSGTAR